VTTAPAKTPSPEFVRIKIAELRGFAKEYRQYAKTMPTDPFATRWHILAGALLYQADGLEKELPPEGDTGSETR
jgi:hypothetical protein